MTARSTSGAAAVLASFAAGVAVAAIAYAGWALSTRGYVHPPRRGGFLAQPLWEGALLLTVSPAKGVLVFAPWLLLAPVGVAPLWRRSPALAVAAVGVFAVQLATFGTWFDWGSGMAYGPRSLAPAAGVLALPSAAALEGAHRARRIISSREPLFAVLAALAAATGTGLLLRSRSRRADAQRQLAA